MRTRSTIAALALCLSGCATSPDQFYNDPSAQDVTSLCRAIAESTDRQFRFDVANELSSRGITADECRKRVATENAVIAGIALVGAAVAVGVAANNGGFGDGGYSSSSDYGVAWDQFYGPYYRPIWRCRDRSSGRFVPDYRCGHLAMVDSAWPGM